ncbi:AMP-binding protein [Chitinophaga sedimenti]|uniref:AMP-binding protein n=1 Tax=Chitinophaga sedimenti TaxID=2033606 RepID=UPI00249E663E|nr:AMP-binding protein [Chitinophaga sedimenti]
MIKPYRLFDAVDVQLEKFPKQEMLSAKINGEWKPFSTQEVRDITNRFSAGLLQLGVSGNDYTPEGADKIAIISNNRPEWVFTDIAVQQTGAVLVPIYPTCSAQELEFILNDAAVKYMFVSSEELLLKVRGISNNVPTLRNIYTFDETPQADHWTKVKTRPRRNSCNR